MHVTNNTTEDALCSLSFSVGMGWSWVFSSDFTDTCACESFTGSGSVRSSPSVDVVVLRDELRSLEGLESNRSAADSITKVVIWWRACNFKCNLFTYEALRSTEELVETCPCVPNWIRVWNVGFGGEEWTEVPEEKPPGAKERTNNKLNPHMASTRTT